MTLGPAGSRSVEAAAHNWAAVTFYTPAETAERYKGAWGVQKPLYLALWGQLPREKPSKIEQYAAHTTNVLGAEG